MNEIPLITKNSELSKNNLTLEEIKIVMSKVENINRKGIAYTSVNYNDSYKIQLQKLKSILKSGVLGTTVDLMTDRDQKSMLLREVNPKKWIEFMQTRKSRPRPPYVYFNIIGRRAGTKEEQDTDLFPQNKSFTIRNYYINWKSKPTITILFNLNHFREIIPEVSKTAINVKAKIGEFTIQQDFQSMLETLREEFGSDFLLPGTSALRPEILEKIPENSYYPPYNRDPKYFFMIKHKFTKDGLIRSDPEFGFKLYGRIAPRSFRGIVFNYDGETDFNPQVHNKIAREKTEHIVRVIFSVYQEKKDNNMLLPIYDIHGNLWWPKELPRTPQG